MLMGIKRYDKINLSFATNVDTIKRELLRYNTRV